jgi:Competence protein
MAGITPRALWDPGFQLSFAATLGLVLYAAPLQDWFTNLLARRLPPATARKVAGPVGSYLLFTLAAHGLTLPIIAYHFQRISLVSLLANPVILPAQPAVMILGGLAVLLGILWQPLGQVLGYLAWPFAAFTIRAVEWFASFPGGNITLGSISLGVVIAIYLLILALTVWRGPARGQAVSPGPGHRPGWSRPDHCLHLASGIFSRGWAPACNYSRCQRRGALRRRHPDLHPGWAQLVDRWWAICQALIRRTRAQAAVHRARAGLAGGGCAGRGANALPAPGAGTLPPGERIVGWANPWHGGSAEFAGRTRAGRSHPGEGYGGAGVRSGEGSSPAGAGSGQPRGDPAGRVGLLSIIATVRDKFRGSGIPGVWKKCWKCQRTAAGGFWLRPEQPRGVDRQPPAGGGVDQRLCGGPGWFAFAGDAGAAAGLQRAAHRP